jgi:hypothetical protein
MSYLYDADTVFAKSGPDIPEYHIIRANIRDLYSNDYGKG